MSICAVIMAEELAVASADVQGWFLKQLLPLLESTTMLQSTFCAWEYSGRIHCHRLRGRTSCMAEQLVLSMDGHNYFRAPRAKYSSHNCLAALARKRKISASCACCRSCDPNRRKITDAVAAANTLAESGKLVTFRLFPPRHRSAMDILNVGINWGAVIELNVL